MHLGADLRTLALLGGSVAVALVLLYLLRPRRRRIEVPFGGLWQRVLAQSEARVLGRQWRRWLSLLLLLGVALLVWLAPAWPLLQGRGAPGTAQLAAAHTVLIVDCSASMATRDGLSADVTVRGTTRLQEAIERTVALVDAAPPQDRFVLIAASGSARVLAGWGTDRAALRKTIAALQPRDAGLDLARAWATAQQARDGYANGLIVIATDGGAPLPAAALPGATAARFVWVGPARLAAQAPNAAAGEALVERAVAEGFDNLAVEQVGIRADPADPGRGTLTVRLRNDTHHDQAVQISLAESTTAQTSSDFSRDLALRRVQLARLPPGSSTQTLPDVDLDAPRLAVHVQPAAGPGSLQDRAPFDDWGFAVLAARRELGVLLVTTQNLFLEAALHASDRTRVQQLSPDRYHPEDFRATDRARHGVDIVVLDNVAAPLPPGTPGLRMLLEVPATDTPYRFAHNPEMVVRAGDHPLMRGVSFQDTNFDRVRLLPTQPGDVVLATAAPSGPTMVARQAGVREIEWGIDLAETDLGGRYALPILMGNAVAWLAGEDDPVVVPLALGRPWAVEAPVAGLRWQWREPGQPPRPARAAGTQLLAMSEIQGIHTWTAPDGRQIARPTLLPATEMPGQVQAQGQPWRAPRQRQQPESTPEWSRSAQLLLAALAVLAVEWLAYLRRRTL